MFVLSAWNLYLREIIFVTEVGVLTIENFLKKEKLVFKPVFLKAFRQFHFLKPLDIFVTLLKHTKKYVCEKGNIDQGRERGCRQNLYRGTKTSDNAGGKPTRGFSLQHRTFSALNYAQDFGTTVKESLKRTTSSKGATLTKSRIFPCQILSCLFQHSQLCLSHRYKQ